ncbi:hypothetical protein EEK90_06985 [Muribaculaceae bacterium Isolate-036 (Harlan)]|nr:hypothetical protein EEK90_06985 [Muribaculaceae bacterium Isolate-036 (Harlan)]
MAKFNQQLVEECEKWVAEKGLMDYGGALLKDFLTHFHIDYKTYKLWLKNKPSFADAISRAKETFKKKLSRDLATTLADAARGGFREEEDETTEYRPNPQNPNQPIIGKMTRSKRKRFIKPDVGAAIFLLTNLDPDHYQNRQRSDISVKKEDDEKSMTIEEINAEIARLEKLDDSGK